MHTDIHASSGIRTHDPSVRAGEDGLCLRSRGHCDRQDKYTTNKCNILEYFNSIERIFFVYAGLERDI
jgi:hypothetical protein